MQGVVHPDWNGRFVLQVMVSKHLKASGEGAKDEPLHTYRDFDSLSAIVNALQDRKPTHTSPQEWAEYAVVVEFTDHTKKDLLLWLGAAGKESALLDSSEKGDSYSLSAQATETLRKQFKP
jgi:hypothetical protein